MPKHPVTHRMGGTTYAVFKCEECHRNVVQVVQEYYGKRAAEELKAKYPMLPDFPAEEICECAENQEDGE